MRIEDLEYREARQRRDDVIRQVQRYQEQQDQIQGGNKTNDKTTIEQQEQASVQHGAQRHDAEVAAVAAHDAQQAALKQQGNQAPSDASGVQKHAEAVSTASRQQDAGENWQAFAERNAAHTLPPSVEEMAQQEGSDNKDPDKVQARELQNELAVQRKQIRG
ncbi:MAG: hypothetical protein AAB426_01125 [Myxococcota bacterium]